VAGGFAFLLVPQLLKAIRTRRTQPAIEPSQP
jgi:hypothetical protein